MSPSSPPEHTSQVSAPGLAQPATPCLPKPLPSTTTLPALGHYTTDSMSSMVLYPLLPSLAGAAAWLQERGTWRRNISTRAYICHFNHSFLHSCKISELLTAASLFLPTPIVLRFFFSKLFQAWPSLLHLPNVSATRILRPPRNIRTSPLTVPVIASVFSSFTNTKSNKLL